MTASRPDMATFLGDYFGIDEALFESYGAINISVVNDLPLFIDPFLLFHSEKPEYEALHEQIIEYLVFLRDRSGRGACKRRSATKLVLFSRIKAELAWLFGNRQ
jgi:hypothetical protein